MHRPRRRQVAFGKVAAALVASVVSFAACGSKMPAGGSSTGTSGGACAQGLTVPCGNLSCPTNSSCAESGPCACDKGFITANCAGTPCEALAAGCAYPNLRCLPQVTGVCGAVNFTVQCSGYVCPAHSVCGANEGCNCSPGFAAVVCDGGDCGKGADACVYPNWWCAAL